jgi:pSer/pThr/pTyr-binding forkhead associated (FHA) protein
MAGLDWVLLALRIITIIILYTFLGVAFYIIWLSLKQVETRAIESKPKQKLRVMSAANEPTLTEEATIPLRQVTLLSQTAGSIFVVSDASASNGHARIYQTNGKWWLEDLGHHNGTLLNEAPITKPVSLADGDVIGIGSARLKFELGEAQAKGEEWGGK